MDIKDEKNIKVLNYNEFNLCIKSNIRGYVLPMASTDNPTFEYMTFEEISYINSNSNGIRNGLIRFEPDKEKTIYKALGVNGDDIMTNEEIENILRNPTKEGMNKIIQISDYSVFKRVKCIFTRIKENPNENLSVQTIRLINQRSDEFSKNIITSHIKIYKDDIPENDNKRLENKIEELESIIKKLTGKSDGSDAAVSVKTKNSERKSSKNNPVSAVKTNGE